MLLITFLSNGTLAPNKRYLTNSRKMEISMDTVLIVLVLILLLGGGGWYGHGRWYNRRPL
jgi:hypothetical protein